MEIVHNATELSRYMSTATELDTKHPVLIDKYLEGKEAEVDASATGKLCSSPASWSTSNVPASIAEIRWRFIPD